MHVYWNNGDSITTAFSVVETVTANFVTMNCLEDNWNDAGSETFEGAITTDSGGGNAPPACAVCRLSAVR